MGKIELLAPAGNLNCLKVAINNGADAIYLGGQDFSARAFAQNFTKEEIIEGLQYAHIKGAKVYVSINTMIHSEQIDSLLKYTDFLYLNGVDALIVADFGLITLLNQRYPTLPIHVSTQMNVHSLWQVKLLEELNIKRVILARETSLSTIKYILKNSKMEIEVFAHGALCVCYSGNCLHSSLIGKRSGNKGSCAQPCRMQYSLLENGKKISDKKYMLSMKDLNTLNQIDELIDSGITSLKIEGRMKDEQYVALVVKTYKDAIDHYYETKEKQIDYFANEKLAHVFSRGFTKGYLFNEKNAELTNTFRPSHIGSKIGNVIAIKKDRIQIKLNDDLSQKDKIAIIQERFEDVRFFVSKIFVKGKLVPKGYKNEVIEIPIISKVAINALVYKISDHDIVEQITQNELQNSKKIPVRMKFFSNVGEPLALSVKDTNNHSILLKSEYIVDKALNSPTSIEKMKEQLLKTNDTNYEVQDISVICDNNGIVPIKYINELRREALNQLNQARSQITNRKIEDIQEDFNYIKKFKKESKKLKVKVHNLYQLAAIASLKGIYSIYYDDLQTFTIAIKEYPHLNIIPVEHRIINDFNKIQINSEAYVINNYGDLLKHENSRLICDSYMNIANELSVASLCDFNIESITISNEMNKGQIQTLIENIKLKYDTLPPLEMVVYGHLQTMISKYCFIAKELGYTQKHCGACKKNQYALLDRMNYIFNVTTDEDCNVTIYNSKALHLIDYIHEILEMGITSIRLDFSTENPQEVERITKAYLAEFNNEEYDLHLIDTTFGYYLEQDN